MPIKKTVSPLTPGEEVPMPSSFGMLLNLLGLLETARKFGPVPASDLLEDEPCREAALWLERHHFYREVGGLAHLTGSGLSFLRQIEIAVDSLSRQFRPSELPKPDELGVDVSAN